MSISVCFLRLSSEHTFGQTFPRCHVFMSMLGYSGEPVTEQLRAQQISAIAASYSFKSTLTHFSFILDITLKIVVLDAPYSHTS